MKIILCYSFAHFNPGLTREDHLRWGTSTNILARSLYEVLSEIGDVTYIDPASIDEYKGRNFDIAIGTIGSFKRLTKNINADIKILFNVQMHPVERALIFLNFIYKNRLYNKNVLEWVEVLSIRKTYFAIKRADFYLGVGNITTQNSFIKYGAKLNKLKFLNYGLLDNNPIGALKVKSFPVINFIYFATEIGLRKGFDVISDIFENHLDNCQDFQLHIVGRATNDYYIRKINSLKVKIGERLLFHGWINSDTAQYPDLLGKMDVLLFPSLEEGQAGTIIDCIRMGVIPVLSRNTGVDFSPLGFFELELENKNNVNLIQSILCKTENELLLLKFQAHQYYNEFHKDFYNVFRETIRNTINRNPYPRLTIIIPLTKEQCKSRLFLKSMKRSLDAYYNIECHIFIDNDYNLSKQLIHKYLGISNDSFSITIHELSDTSYIKSINLTLRNSTGKYCMFIHDDTLLKQKNFLYDAVYFLERNEKTAILGLTALINNVDHTSTINKIDKGNGSVLQNKKISKSYHETIYFKVDSFCGNYLIMRRSFLDETNFLSESSIEFKDIYSDLSSKAQKKGYFVYCYYSNDQTEYLIQNNLGNHINNWFRRDINSIQISSVNSSPIVTNDVLSFIKLTLLLLLPAFYKIREILKGFIKFSVNPKK